MRKLALLILALTGLYFYYPKLLKANSASSEVIAYGEARVTFNYPGRDIEGVSIIEINDANACNNGYAEETLEACISQDICVQQKFQCKTEISSQYKNMLAQKPGALHYLHYKGKQQPINGILMMWGLTRDESKEACEHFLKKYSSGRAKKLTNYNVSCI